MTGFWTACWLCSQSPAVAALCWSWVSKTGKYMLNRTLRTYIWSDSASTQIHDLSHSSCPSLIALFVGGLSTCSGLCCWVASFLVSVGRILGRECEFEASRFSVCNSLTGSQPGLVSSFQDKIVVPGLTNGWLRGWIHNWWCHWCWMAQFLARIPDRRHLFTS